MADGGLEQNKLDLAELMVELLLLLVKLDLMQLLTLVVAVLLVHLERNVVMATLKKQVVTVVVV
jgi:hypothetical protein